MTESMHVSQYNNLIRKKNIKVTAVKKGGITISESKGKYRNKIVTTEDGLRFDSKKEYEEWMRLKALAKTGAIQDLKRQVKYPLVVNGQKVCTYISDFDYMFKGELISADSKGAVTPVFRIKEKLFYAIYKRRIKRC